MSAEVVALGARDSWSRPPNREPGCTCPPWRYNPRVQVLRPTDPGCELHGDA